MAPLSQLCTGSGDAYCEPRPLPQKTKSQNKVVSTRGHRAGTNRDGLTLAVLGYEELADPSYC